MKPSRALGSAKVLALNIGMKDALQGVWFLKLAYRLPTDSRNKKAAL